MKQENNRFVNVAFTKRIAQLHQAGYSKDYSITGSQTITCIQDNLSFNYDQVNIKLVDHVQDQLLKRFCYLHTVETEAGDKGILMLQNIFFNAPSFEKKKSYSMDAFWAAF